MNLYGINTGVMKILDVMNENKWGQRSVPLSDYFKFHDRFDVARQAFDQRRRIYRGIHLYEQNFFYQPQLDPGTRRSSNTYNWYTLIMDHVPEWQDFPRRSASVICTTDPVQSSDYGITYTVLPFGNPTIGISPREDIWFSFPSLKKLEMESLEELMDALDTLAYTYLDKPLSQNSWPDFNRGLREISQKILQEYHRSQWDNVNKLQGRVTPQRDMLAVLREILDPQAAGFRTAKLSEWQPQPDREIWFSAPAFFLNSNWLGSTPQGLDARMKEIIGVEVP